MTLDRRSFNKGLAAALFTPALAPIARGQSAYPNKPITIIVPYEAGGPIDVMMRYLAEKLYPVLGQRVLVESKAGASGAIGLEYVMRSPKDGYTLIATSANDIALMKAVRGDTLNFDPVEDPYPVARLYQRPYMLFSRPDLGFESVQDLIEAAKADPGGLTYATSGQGSHAHLAAEMFNRAAGISAIQIPYKGTGPATLAVVGGEVDFTFGSPSQYAQYAVDGQVTALGSSSLTPFSLLPQVPAIANTVPGYVSIASVDIFVPRGVPRDTLDILNQAFAELVTDPEVIERIHQSGEILSATPAELDADLKAQYIELAEVVKDLDLIP